MLTGGCGRCRAGGKFIGGNAKVGVWPREVGLLAWSRQPLHVGYDLVRSRQPRPNNVRYARGVNWGEPFDKGPVGWSEPFDKGSGWVEGGVGGGDESDITFVGFTWDVDRGGRMHKAVGYVILLCGYDVLFLDLTNLCR